jgi:dTDP-4-dehydrorhamnose reductase
MIQDKFFIVGGDSKIGRAFSLFLKSRDNKVIISSRKPEKKENVVNIDLNQDPDSWEIPEDCSIGLICAGITSIAECEKNYDFSYRINVSQTVALARKLIENGMFIVFLSTNMVFDGEKPFCTEDAETNPKNKYGYQKAETEKQILNLEGNIAVIRLTKVLSPDMPLVNRWRKSLKNNEVINPFQDMKLSPLAMEFLLTSMETISKSKKSGVFHLSGNKDISYAEMAYFIAEKEGFSRDLIVPVNSNMEPAFRPANTVLSMVKMGKFFSIYPPNVYNTIENLLIDKR